MNAKKALFVDFVSNAMCIAPAGSGKGIGTVIPNILSIHGDKVTTDFKGEIFPIVQQALIDRGERVIPLNPGYLWPDIIGEGAHYNPLELIVQNLYRKDGIKDMLSDLREIAAQLYPEPEGKAGGDDKFWRDGSRKVMALVTAIEIMVEEEHASLSGIARILEDRWLLEDNLRFVLGLDAKGKFSAKDMMPIEQTDWAQAYHDPEDIAEFTAYLRAMAANALKMMTGDESRTFDSFLSGAQLALAPFAAGRLSKTMQRCDFSMNELKESDKPVSLFIIADSSRMEVFKPYLGLIQWAALTAIKRHENKKRPVYFICDEATNYKIHDLESLLTWGRGFGIRLLLIFQDISAFERVYGKQALETLISETEIKQFLPGTRSTRTLKLVSEMLGKQSVMAADISQHGFRLSENYRETGRPLMTDDEIRRSPYGILFVRQLPPILFEAVSYSAVFPWREMAGVNPFYGKPFMQKIKLKLGGIWRKTQ